MFSREMGNAVDQLLVAVEVFRISRFYPMYVTLMQNYIIMGKKTELSGRFSYVVSDYGVPIQQCMVLDTNEVDMSAP